MKKAEERIVQVLRTDDGVYVGEEYVDDLIRCKDCGHCTRRMWDYACEKDGLPGKVVDPEYHCGDAIPKLTDCQWG